MLGSSDSGSDGDASSLSVTESSLARDRGPTSPGARYTFLFTDVVGSTRLWEARPQDMADAMELHDAVLRAAFTANGAAVVKNTGDGFMAVFADASDGVAAAVALQRGLLAADWPGGLRPEIRAGLHTGAAAARSGDFFGGTVNRAARVAQVAHGGQVILSAATARDAVDELGTIDLIDLGGHRLRDLAGEEQLLQVAADGLAVSFPPLLTLDHFRHNLPVERSSFVGRAAELQMIDHLLALHRLVTLRGVGGAGKTRLALQAAAERMDDYPEGVWLARLDTIDADEDVVHAVAAAVGAAGGAGSTAEQDLADWGRNRTALLLLDTCEHVIEAVAGLSVYLLERCPDLQLLATSREVIGISGETVYEVGPMSREPVAGGTAAPTMSDAGALFVDRARAVLPGFAVTEENAPLVSEICDRLDGIPLALELAAARLKVLSLAELAQRLGDRFRLLAGGDRTAMPRQRTLQAAVEWSYDLLTEDEKLVFERLAVFRGGFTLEAAEAVAGAEAGEHVDVLGLLARLVDRSMVTVDHLAVPAGTRFGMLDTLREYSTQRLEASGAAEVFRRHHARFFAALAAGAEAELRGRDEGIWLERLDSDYANIRRAVTNSLTEGPLDAALQILGDLKLYFIARDGLMPEVRRWIDALVAAQPDPEPALAHALSTGGVLAWSQGDLASADELHSRSLELAHRLGGPEDVFRATGDLGLVAVDLGERERARELFVEGLGIARGLDEPGDVAIALSNLASVEAPDAQADLLEEALRIHHETGRQTGIAHVSLMVGWLQLSNGDLEGAGESFTEASRGFADLGNQGSAVVALCGLVDTSLQAGEHDQATAEVAAAEAVARKMDWPGISAIVSTRRAAIARRTDPAWSLQELAQAAEAWESSGLEAGLAENYGFRALVALDVGDVDAAAAWSTQSRDRWLQLGRAAGIAWSTSIVAVVEQDGIGCEGALGFHGGALAAYSLARVDPQPLDGFLAPTPGSLAAKLDALERAAICALRAGRERDGAIALAAAAAERLRTGIIGDAQVAREGRTVTEGASSVVPAQMEGDFDQVLDQIATSFAEAGGS